MQNLQDLNNLTTNILNMLSDNIIPVIIIITMTVYFLFNYINQKNNPKTKEIRHYWNAIRKDAVRLTDKFFATVGDMDAPAFYFSGELYQINSETYDEITEQEMPVYLSEAELKSLKAKEKDLPEEERTAIYHNDSGDYALKTVRTVEKRKSITALAMIPTKKGGEIIAIRRNRLRETETILSETDQQPLINLDPNLALSHTRMAMFGLVVYELIIIYMMITNTDPSLLISASSWPWYIVLILAWWTKVKVDTEKTGFKALYRGVKMGEESFRLRNPSGDQPLVLTTPVYEVELHFHPAIPTKNVLKGVGKEEIYDEKLSSLERKNTFLSSENTSLKSRLEQMHEIIRQKDDQLVAARNEHLNAFDDGFVTGYARFHVSTDEELQLKQLQMQQGGVSGLDWFRELKLPLIVLMLLGVIYFIGTGLTDAISNAASKPGGGIDFFNTNMLLGLGLIIVLLIVASSLLRGK